MLVMTQFLPLTGLKTKATLGLVVEGESVIVRDRSAAIGVYITMPVVQPPGEVFDDKSFPTAMYELGQAFTNSSFLKGQVNVIQVIYTTFMSRQVIKSCSTLWEQIIQSHRFKGMSESNFMQDHGSDCAFQFEELELLTNTRSIHSAVKASKDYLAGLETTYVADGSVSDEEILKQTGFILGGLLFASQILDTVTTELTLRLSVLEGLTNNFVHPDVLAHLEAATCVGAAKFEYTELERVYKSSDITWARLLINPARTNAMFYHAIAVPYQVKNKTYELDLPAAPIFDPATGVLLDTSLCENRQGELTCQTIRTTAPTCLSKNLADPTEISSTCVFKETAKSLSPYIRPVRHGILVAEATPHPINLRYGGEVIPQRPVILSYGGITSVGYQGDKEELPGVSRPRNITFVSPIKINQLSKIIRPEFYWKYIPDSYSDIMYLILGILNFLLVLPYAWKCCKCISPCCRKKKPRYFSDVSRRYQRDPLVRGRDRIEAREMVPLGSSRPGRSKLDLNVAWQDAKDLSEREFVRKYRDFDRELMINLYQNSRNHGAAKGRIQVV